MFSFGGLKTRYMENLRQIHNIIRNNFNKIRKQCTLTTELNFDVINIIEKKLKFLFVSRVY